MSLDITSVFTNLSHLGRLKHKEEYSTIILTQTVDQLIVGSRLVIKNKIDNHDNLTKTCITSLDHIFTSGSINQNSNKHTIEVQGVRPVAIDGNEDAVFYLTSRQFKMAGRSFLNDHKLKEVDEFNTSKLQEIKEYTDRYSSITFRVHNNKQAAKCLYKLNDFTNSFKYSRLANQYVSDYVLDETIPLFTFINLSECIPIFNPRRLDGIVIYLQAISKLTTTPITVAKLLITTNNYLDNVFVIDGQTINVTENIHKGIWDSFAKMILQKGRVDKAKESINLESIDNACVCASTSTH